MGNIIVGNEGDMIEVTLRDFSGKKIESWRCPTRDRKSITRIIKLIEDKYGIKKEEDFLSLDNEFLKF